MSSKRLYGQTSFKGRTGTPAPLLKCSSKNISPDSPENGVVIPYIKSEDNAEHFPKYTAALARPTDDFLPAEDLDSVQLELELLLSSVSQRFRILKTEHDAIEKEDKRDRRSRFIEKPPTSPGKRRRADEKKLKDRFMPSLKFKATSISPAQSHHTDDSLDSLPHITPADQKNLSKPPIHKNDVPNKFWLSVEPYCMPITNEDLKILDDLLEQYKDAMVPAIPELGPHYSKEWAAEDLKDERNISNTISKAKSRQDQDIFGMLRKGEKQMGDNMTGPFTQRFVSALMDENLVSDVLSTAANNDSSKNMINSFAVRSISLMKNGINVEKRLKEELMQHGILDRNEFEHQDDEILAEIKRVTTELSAIADFNSLEIRKLSYAGKGELNRIELKRKLDIIDQEIIESYKKVLSAKQKRRQLTSQEKDDIFRLTAEQKLLSDQLEKMGMPGPKYLD